MINIPDDYIYTLSVSFEDEEPDRFFALRYSHSWNRLKASIERDLDKKLAWEKETGYNPMDTVWFAYHKFPDGDKVIYKISKDELI